MPADDDPELKELPESKASPTPDSPEKGDEPDEPDKFSEPLKAAVGISLFLSMWGSAVLTDSDNTGAVESLGWGGVALTACAVSLVAGSTASVFGGWCRRRRAVLRGVATICVVVGGYILVAFGNRSYNLSLGTEMPGRDKFFYSLGAPLFALGGAVLAALLSEWDPLKRWLARGNE